MKNWSPQERLFVSMRISTEPENKEQEKPGTAGIGLPKQ
jgi:hypothetical protein